MRAGGPRKICFASLFALLLLGGCSSRRTDLLENELRAKDNLYRESLEDQHRAENRIDALQREIAALRHGSNLSPEQANSTFSVRRLVLGRGTGGYDQDTLPGDELLQVIVEPKDCDDHTIKVPGTLQILALEVHSNGLKTPISTWEISQEDLRRSWKQGLLTTGYNLLLPWKQFPRTENLRIVVRLCVTDGRVYEADKDVRVHVLPGAVQHGLPPTANLDLMPIPQVQAPPLAPIPQVQPPPLEPIPQVLPAPKILPQSASDPWVTPSGISISERRVHSGSIGLGTPQPLRSE